MSKKRQFVVRFAAMRNGKVASSIWRIWKGRNNDNVYLAVRSIAGLAKATFHENRYCHLALTLQYWRTKPTDAPMRTVVHWMREDLPIDAVKSVAAIIIPDAFLAEGSQTIDTDTYLLEAPGAGKAIIVESFYSTYAPGGTKIPEGSRELGHIELSNGEHFVVIGGIVPFDAEEFKKTNHWDRPRPINIEDPNLVSANRMLLINDPAQDGNLRIIDVGGIKVERTIDSET